MILGRRADEGGVAPGVGSPALALGPTPALTQPTGEKISPLALEEPLLRVRGVQTCVCFAVDAALYGEVVGVALVPKPGEPPPTLPELHAGLGDAVSSRWRPQVLALGPGQGQVWGEG